MGAIDQLNVRVSFKARGATRKFDPSYEATAYGRAFQGISERPYARRIAWAYRKVHDVDSPGLEDTIYEEIFLKQDEVFTAEQELPWYLSEFFLTLKASKMPSASIYQITIKGCRDHLFYKLEQLDSSGDLRLMHSPFFQKAPPPEFPAQEPEKVRGLADTLLFLAPSIHKLNDDESLIELIGWFDINLRCRITDVLKDSLELNLRASVGRRRCISVPPKNREVLVVSPNVRQAVAALSEVWQNPLAKSALISAWTGSGKEVLVDLLTDAALVPPEHRINVSAPQARNFDGFRARVSRRYRPSARMVVFVDEIHHQGVQELRSGLLRLMETDRFEKTDGDVVDCDTFLYVLAASIPPDKLRSLPPIDLWTRIEYMVQLRHPLLVADEETREDTLREYFKLFWSQQRKVRGHLQASPVVDSIVEVLLTDQTAEGLSLAFSDALGSPLIPLVSIRT